MRVGLSTGLLLLLAGVIALLPPSPNQSSSRQKASTSARAEVRAWLRQTLPQHDHIRWLEPGLGRWFFNSDDGLHGAELWESDLTPSGTRLLYDINNGPASSHPKHKVEYNGRIYFSADDGIHGVELWVTDGTPNGTSLLVDIFAGPESSHAQGLTSCGGWLYFAAADLAHGYELWVSDGTPDGTLLLQDITPGPHGSHLTETICEGGLLYFTVHERFRWLTDGSRRGTRLASSHMRTEL